MTRRGRAGRKFRVAPEPPGNVRASHLLRSSAACHPMKDSERYLAQAETVLRLAARAESPAEKAVYLRIADGWRKLAAEVKRGEAARETRSFKPTEG